MSRVRTSFRFKSKGSETRRELRVQSTEAVAAGLDAQPQDPRRPSGRERAKSFDGNIERGLIERRIEHLEQSSASPVVHLADEPQRDVKIGRRNPSRVAGAGQFVPERLGYTGGSFPDRVVQFDANKEPQGWPLANADC
jgi:hypothetical protein